MNLAFTGRLPGTAAFGFSEAEWPRVGEGLEMLQEALGRGRRRGRRLEPSTCPVTSSSKLTLWAVAPTRRRRLPTASRWTERLWPRGTVSTTRTAPVRVVSRPRFRRRRNRLAAVGHRDDEGQAEDHAQYGAHVAAAGVGGWRAGTAIAGLEQYAADRVRRGGSGEGGGGPEGEYGE